MFGWGGVMTALPLFSFLRQRAENRTALQAVAID